MKLSIVVCNRDRIKWGDPACELFLKSIQWQDFKDFELVIVDGGSSNFKEIKNGIESFEGPIPMRVIYRPTTGLFNKSYLLNVGIQQAAGEYILSTDIDLIYNRYFVSAIADAVEENILVQAKAFFLYDERTKDIQDGKLDPYGDFAACLSRPSRHKGGRSFGSPGPCQCLHRDIWNTIRGFHEDMYGWGSCDRDITKRCGINAIKLKWLPDPPMMLHQYHAKDELEKEENMRCQNINKKIMEDNSEFAVNESGWGDFKESDTEVADVVESIEVLDIIENSEKDNKNVKEKPMLLEICANCWNYQHRLNWMLSSIALQEGNPPDILFNVSYAPNNGEPTTEEILGYFKHEVGLNIKKTVMKDKEEVSCRGKIRDQQLQETEADWILFVDCDQVYSPFFFDDLRKQMEGDLKDVDKCITADRVSLNIPFCIEFFNRHPLLKPCVVPNVTDIVSEWPVWRYGGKSRGAGNFQLAKVSACREKTGRYSHFCRDIWRGTKSDSHFRKNMGGIHPIDVKPQYHLNHDRGGPDKQR